MFRVEYLICDLYVPIGQFSTYREARKAALAHIKLEAGTKPKWTPGKDIEWGRDEVMGAFSALRRGTSSVQIATWVLKENKQ